VDGHWGQVCCHDVTLRSAHGSCSVAPPP
jgi:hypothetical protein